MLLRRLGLQTARIPQADRHGLIWLSRGALTVRDGTLHFLHGPELAENDPLAPGDHGIPFQTVSMILLGPGSTVSHDALRLLARHGTGLAAVGEDGVRLYTAPPLISNRSEMARRQALAWADRKKKSVDIARKMYEWRFQEVLPETYRTLDLLRGLEGARAKRVYVDIANRYKITWQGRKYDRSNPDAADLPNQAINHSATAVEAAAAIAVSATATIPQLGFVHEDSSQAFVLDIADLFRDTVTVPAAFKAAAHVTNDQTLNIERTTRKITGNLISSERTIPRMIDQIKELFIEP